MSGRTCSNPLTPFVSWRRQAPYEIGGYLVVPVRSKAPLAISKASGVAHLIGGVAATCRAGRVRYGVRWMCGNGSVDALLIGRSGPYGGTCERCLDVMAGPCVYRCFATDGRLLYVGSTVNRSRRMSAHAGKSPWWGEVADVRIERHPDIVIARAIERAAIRAEAPTYNRAYNRALRGAA
jgi:hypothetical protein